ncbi:MAG: hypothetical protein PHV49_04815, partial [Alistipes sp.]|nr:hypothetical protein [Alistipes sp.]
MKKLILTCCQIAAILVLASCSKNDTTDISDTLPVETAYGVFNGINVLNYHPNQGTLEVPLFTQGNVRIVKISKNHIVANVIRRVGEHKLQITLNTKDSAFTYPFSFDIEVAYPSSLAKSGEKSSKLTVVCQDTPIAKDIYEVDPANAIGKGMNLAGDFAGYNQLARVLDYGAILSSIEAGKTTN